MPSARQPQTVLVTGGCGFIGSAFMRYLSRLLEFTANVLNLDLLLVVANR